MDKIYEEMEEVLSEIKKLQKEKKEWKNSPEGIAFKKRKVREYQEQYREKYREKNRKYQRQYAKI